jgi:hypothetical protein
MEMPPFLALDAVNRSISNLALGFSIQRNANGKTARLIASNDLNAGHRLAAWPLPDGIEALFSQSLVFQPHSKANCHAWAVLSDRITVFACRLGRSTL